MDGLIEELDRNKDGKISKDEARDLLRGNFEHLDINKDGFLDREELLRAASENPALKLNSTTPRWTAA